jgi:acetyl-CoA carboxylase biotin carboxyl carrier protein
VKKPARSRPAKAAKQPAGQSLPDSRKQIHELVELLNETNLVELEVERNGLRIRVRRESAGPVVVGERRRGSAASPAPPAQPQPAPSAERSGLVTISSPIVGTFYRSPSPDADPYVEEGDLVKKGQVLCLVEAMKLMNEIESEVDGRVVQILVESTKPVEYGQPLMLIDPTPAP